MNGEELAMYPINTSSLPENTVITNDIYDQDGSILLLRGTRLRPRIIEFLKQKGIDRVFLLTQPETHSIAQVPEDDLDVLIGQPSIDTQVYLQKHFESATLPMEILDALHGSAQTLYRRLPVDGKIEIEPLRYVASEAADFIMEMPASSLTLNDLTFFATDLPTHAVNVAILSLFTGRYFGLARRHLRDIVLGALMHDVGLTVSGTDLSDYSGRPHAEKASPIPINTHPETGARLLRKNRIRDEAIINIVYNHHERHDGLGYPRKLSGSEITLTSAIVALANDFVTLSNPMATGGLMPGSQVMSQIMRDIEKAYSPHVAGGFIETVGIYPVGSFLLLSSGDIGITVDNPSGNVLTPRLMLIRNAKGEEFSEPAYLDLGQNDDVNVAQVLSPM